VVPPEEEAARCRNGVVSSNQFRLANFAEEALKKASNLPPGSDREEMLKKVRQADIASHLDEWAHSRGPQPPTRSNDDP